jgi:hypothetical protein
VGQEAEVVRQVTRAGVQAGTSERGSAVGQRVAHGVAFEGVQAVARAEARYVARIGVL